MAKLTKAHTNGWLCDKSDTESGKLHKAIKWTPEVLKIFKDGISAPDFKTRMNKAMENPENFTWVK